MTPPINYYTVLGVEENATDRQIQAAFRRAAFEHHPDRHNNDGTAQETTILLNEAYEVLSDPDRRAEHDRRLRRYHVWTAGVQQEREAHRLGMAPPPMAEPRPRRVRSFGVLILAAWIIVELSLFTVDRVLPRLGNGDPPPNWFWDSFSGEFMTPTVAVAEGDAAFVVNSVSAAVGFLAFLVANACFRLAGRSSRH